MTRLLLITDDSTSAQTLPTALASSADFQVHHRARIADARGALAAGAFDAALFLPGRLDADFHQEIAAAREAAPALALVVVAPAGAGPEAQARLLGAGADSVLFQPLDVADLGAHLTRLSGRMAASPAATVSDPGPAASPRLTAKAAALSSALEVLRDFSQVLGYSLDYRQLTQHFILKLREVVGLSRIAIFLEPGAVDPMPAAAQADNTRLPCTAAVGISADLVECFSLTRRSGLGRQLTHHPQILRAPAQSHPPMLDPKIAREFDVLGGQVAIPVNDRERTLGVAVLGGRITGGEFSDEELLLVYHLLEELGLAVKNSWLHHQLVGSHRLFSTVLNGLTVGACVIGPTQQVVYANRAIIDFLAPGAVQLDVHGLPPVLAAKIHEVVERGVEVEPFFHETEGAAPRLFRASVIPLRQPGAKLPQTALVLLEDFTQIRSAQRAEIESSNLKLISLIARRFAHEIRNALVPLTTHAQLFDSEIGQEDFRASLKDALARETQRIQRFTDQMLLLARSDQTAAELAPLDDILRTSFEKSRAYLGGEAELEIRSELPSVLLRCNRASLAHAFQEIFLNGLQSGTEDDAAPRRLVVTLNAEPVADGRAELVVQVRDSGRGFAAESAPRATEPFYTTRNTGVGLGLTIARRVIEAHSGRLDVHPRHAPADPDLTIRLPLPR